MYKHLSKFLMLTITLYFFSAVNSQPLPPINKALGNATVTTSGDTLLANSGVIERKFKWTGKGFVSIGLKNIKSGKEWCTAPTFTANWMMNNLIDNTSASLTSLTCEKSTDENFTAEHLEIKADMEYAGPKVALRFLIWVYPDAPGMRTQVWVKGLSGYSAPSTSNANRMDYIPLDPTETIRREIGYYNDTQNRNKKETELLREESDNTSISGTKNYQWGSILCVEKNGDGFAMVKESHKCVNQVGYKCGGFHIIKDDGLTSSGWAMAVNEITTSEYRQCWANWTIVYNSSNLDLQRQIAIKTFDRHRYPVDPARDIYIQANTWGSGNNKDAARESNVLLEINVQSELGIDVQQIDDGWQANDWSLRRDWYPNGWTKVKERAQEKGVKVGLWAAAIPVPLDKLKWHYDNGGFVTYKLDFANLNTHKRIKDMVDKVRSFVKYTNHRVRLNWDVTEVQARFGYYWAREYGCIYLENRKPAKPEKVLYIPYLVLRDLWQLSKYANLNKYQGTIQNIERVVEQATWTNGDVYYSDAKKHNHRYITAIPLMSTPLFFQETHYYSDTAKVQVREVLTQYKRYRNRMYDGYVYPIGDKPDNASWTGFQNHNEETGTGYLTAFRERLNNSSQKNIKLHFLAGKTKRFINIRTDEQWETTIGSDGGVDFQINSAPDFLFYKYDDSLSINNRYLIPNYARLPGKKVTLTIYSLNGRQIYGVDLTGKSLLTGSDMRSHVSKMIRSLKLPKGLFLVTVGGSRRAKSIYRMVNY